MVLLCLVFTVSACSAFHKDARRVATITPSASPSNTPPKVTPKPSHSPSPTAKPSATALNARASQIECQSGPGYIMWQSQHVVGNITLKIADLQCDSSTAPKFGQVIESFTLIGGVWVSQGLASGPDVSFRTIGQCLEDLVNKTSCPAQIVSEDGGQIDGTLTIASRTKHTTWNFTAN